MHSCRLHLSTPVFGWVVFVTASCTGNSGDIGGPPTDVESVAVSPSRSRAAVGSTVQLTAAALDAGGNAVATGVTYRWSSLRPGVATVDQTTGTARGVSIGSATIRVTATLEGRGSAQADAVLEVEEVADVYINPASATLHVGSETVLSGRAYFSDGGSATGVPFRWRSSDNTVAAVQSSEGASTKVVGIAPGTARIIVNAVTEGRLGQGAHAEVLVLAAP